MSEFCSKRSTRAAWCLVLALCLAPELSMAQNGNASEQGQAHGRGSARATLGAGNGEGLVHGQGQGLDAMRPDEDAYYLARRDIRRCIFPLCGGWFVSAVNRDSTTCVDGTVAEECYVAEVNGVTIGNYALLFGRVGEVTFPDYGVGSFDATEGWRSIGGGTGSGLGVLLEDLGIVCLVAPCFTYEETELNGDARSIVSGVDLGAVNATPEDIDAALLALQQGGLLAIGDNVAVPNAGPGGGGIDFVATDAYLPLP